MSKIFGVTLTGLYLGCRSNMNRFELLTCYDVSKSSRYDVSLFMCPCFSCFCIFLEKGREREKKKKEGRRRKMKNEKR